MSYSNLEATHLANAGSTTRVLDELEQSDFIRRYTAFGQKKRDELYQLTDAYTLFYFHFLKDGKNDDKQFWEHHLGTPKINSWAGYAFEQETKTRKSCQQVMVTTYGLVKNQYTGIIQRELTMEDLFL